MQTQPHATTFLICDNHSSAHACISSWRHRAVLITRHTLPPTTKGPLFRAPSFSEGQWGPCSGPLLPPQKSWPPWESWQRSLGPQPGAHPMLATGYPSDSLLLWSPSCSSISSVWFWGACTRWRNKPKFHLMEDVIEYKTVEHGPPCEHWAYKYESWGICLSHDTARRGGKNKYLGRGVVKLGALQIHYVQTDVCRRTQLEK